MDAQLWGDDPPSERLRTLKANTSGLAGIDRPLLDSLGTADPATLRAIAQWATRRFDDPALVWRLLLGPNVEVRNVHVRAEHATSATHRAPRIDTRSAALPTLFAAVDPDPLKAALDALYAAALSVGDDRTACWPKCAGPSPPCSEEAAYFPLPMETATTTPTNTMAKMTKATIPSETSAS